MNPEQLKEINEIDWWHDMELDGIMTNGEDYTQDKLAVIQMPEDLTGKSVIDVGAWDGFFSFEAERRGGKVLAIDTLAWERGWETGNKIWKTGKQGFDFAHKILNSKVESKNIEVMDLDKNWFGFVKGHPNFQFDLVLCLGILYHMKNPLGMCQVMYDICKSDGLLIIESHFDVDDEKPLMKFYPTDELNRDSGNWWGPNPQCIEAMLRAVGFKDIKKVLQDNKAYRVVFHARK